MASVSEAFASVDGRAGTVLGVIPGEALTGRAKPGYPNRWVEVVVRTHLPLTGGEGLEPMSRNHINVLSSDILVGLPGSAGTASEVALALRYGRPIIAFLRSTDEIRGLPEGVPMAGSLAEVQRFVEGALDRPRT